MKIKFLFIAAIVTLSVFKVQAQGAGILKDSVASILKHVIERIGTSADNIIWSTHEFRADYSDQTYLIYRYSRDTSLRIGIKREDVYVAVHIYIILPQSYTSTVQLVLASLNYKPTDGADAAYANEFVKARDTIIWQRYAENGMMVLRVTENY